MSALSIADLALLVKASPSKVREACIRNGWLFDATGRVHIPPGRAFNAESFMAECRAAPLIAGMRCIR